MVAFLIPIVAGLALAGAGAAVYFALRDPDRLSPSELAAQGIPSTRAPMGTITAEPGPLPTIGAETVLPERMPMPDLAPGLEVWGKKPGEGTWAPALMKSMGCTDMEWGVCFADWIDTLQKDPDAPGWTKNLDQRIYRFADSFLVGAGVMAEWLVDRACLRFKVPLYAYRLTDKGTTYYAVERHDAPILLRGATPPHPLPKRSGYNRVWISSVQATMTRSDDAMIVYWPEQDPPNVKELLPRKTIRGLLRMDPDYAGAVSIKQLVRADCGKSRWYLSSREKAMNRYR